MAPTPEEMQQRLDKLERDIEAARRQAEADGLLGEEVAEQEPTLANPTPEEPRNDGLPGDATG